jgi:uncharacterized phage protein gp47/JayE
VTSLSDLLSTPTSDEVKSTLLGMLETVGFPTSSWKPTSVPIRLLDATSEVIADLGLKVAILARAGFSELAEAEWLSLRSEDSYQNTRQPAVATVGTITLTDGGGGPYVIAAGSLIAVAETGQRYRNITGGTLALNDTLDLEFRAEAVGESYNVAGSTVTELATPLAGVTISAASDWITTAGSDGETDARLRERNRTKWATLATGSPASAYVAWILDAAPNISKVSVRDDNPLGQQSVQVVCATGTGPASAADVALAQAAIDAKRPVGTLLEAISATSATVTVTGTVYVRAASLVAAQAAAVAGFAALTEELEIGATVYLSRIIDTIHTSSAVRNVVLTAPGGDTALTPLQVATFSLNLTWTAV